MYQHDDRPIKTKYIKTDPKTIINKVTSPDLNFDYSINPYQGCEHGCIYCYARPTHNYWGYSSGLDFETKILVKENAAELLEKKISKKSWDAKPIMLSGNTDCYQIAESKFLITRRLLEVFWRYRHPVNIITKNHLILRDIDIISKLALKNLVRVAISITTQDEEIRRIMEPRTSSFKNRIKAIKKLSEAKVPVTAMLAPIIPGLNDSEILSLAQKASEAGARAMNHTIVRLNGQIAEIFEQWLTRNLPERADRIIAQIKACHDGQLSDHRMGKRMRGTGRIAEMIQQQAKLARLLYFKDRKLKELDCDLHHTIKNRQLSLF